MPLLPSAVEFCGALAQPLDNAADTLLSPVAPSSTQDRCIVVEGKHIMWDVISELVSRKAEFVYVYVCCGACYPAHTPTPTHCSCLLCPLCFTLTRAPTSVVLNARRACTALLTLTDIIRFSLWASVAQNCFDQHRAAAVKKAEVRKIMREHRLARKRQPFDDATGGSASASASAVPMGSDYFLSPDAVGSRGAWHATPPGGIGVVSSATAVDGGALSAPRLWSPLRVKKRHNERRASRGHVRRRKDGEAKDPATAAAAAAAAAAASRRRVIAAVAVGGGRQPKTPSPSKSKRLRALNSKRKQRGVRRTKLRTRR